MQVASASELSTSATLGGGKTIDFGISDDPAFFQILSANLYSNQKLAVVRETLCNLWDAHIDAGITDTCGSVEITDNELVFRDYGKGIHPDLMGQVYGTYGASTKKNDSKSTGGFGLGCKSPFAYTDSFRVTSYHNGTMTVYNITKSSIESNGKPGITEIMQSPTSQTGLEVRIPIDKGDIPEFINYIHHIVKHGEMKISLKVSGYYSGSSSPLLRTMNMSFEPGSYNINSESWYDEYMGNHEVFVRYGNVIYPALDTVTTRPAVDTIKRFMRILGINRIVVQAAPDSLALTPSREALSSQKMTENGIVDLCLELTKQIEKDIRKELPEQIHELADSIRNMGTHRFDDDKWIDWIRLLPSLPSNFLRSNMGEKLRKHWQVFMRNAEMSAYRKQYKNLKYGKQVLKAVYVAKQTNDRTPYAKLHWHYIAKPLIKVLRSRKIHAGAFRSVVYHPYRHIATKDHHKFHMGMSIPAMVYAMHKKVIFITTRLREVEYSCESWPGFNFKEVSGHKSYFIYHIGKKKDENLVPVGYFTKQGWEVIDLTLNHEWDPNVREKKARITQPKDPKVKVSNGLIPLRNIWSAGDKGHFIFTRSLVKDKTSWQGGTDAPIFYVDYDDVRLNKLGRYCTPAMMTDDFLDNSVIVRNGIERNMAIRRGAISVDEYFIKPLMAIYMGTDMKQYITRKRSPDLSTVHKIKSPLLKLIKSLGINVPGLNKIGYRADLEAVLEVINLDSLYRLHHDKLITDDEYEAAKVVAEYKLQEFAWIKQLKAIMKDAVIHELDITFMREALAVNPERKAAFRSLVLIAMKNGTKK